MGAAIENSFLTRLWITTGAAAWQFVALPTADDIEERSADSRRRFGARPSRRRIDDVDDVALPWARSCVLPVEQRGREVERRHDRVDVSLCVAAPQ